MFFRIRISNQDPVLNIFSSTFLQTYPVPDQGSPKKDPDTGKLSGSRQKIDGPGFCQNYTNSDPGKLYYLYISVSWQFVANPNLGKWYESEEIATNNHRHSILGGCVLYIYI